MTTAELLTTIRAEIERRLKYTHDWLRGDEKRHPNQSSVSKNYYKMKGDERTLDAVLSFLDTLESEEPTLTWGDVQLLDTFILECAREEREGKDWGESEEFYTEVLRRYNDFVKRTIPEIVSKIHEYNEHDRKDSPEN
jgi:hypothetical protein